MEENKDKTVIDENKAEQNKKPDRNSIKSILKSIFSLTDDAASSDEIRTRILDGGRVTGTNASVLFCAIIIASVGLITNSTAVIIGAMLVSPIMGSILGLSYGTVTGSSPIIKRYSLGFLTQIVISVGTSTLFFLLIPDKEPTSELIARTQPDFYDVLIATFGGLAGIIGNTRRDKANNVIPGVAIATALMPPLCTCGYSIANGKWHMLVMAAYLFTINSYFIYSSAEIVLSFLDLPEKMVLTKQERRKYIRRKRWITILVLIPCFVLLGVRIAMERS